MKKVTLTFIAIFLASYIPFSYSDEEHSEVFELRTGFYIKSFPEIQPADIEIALRYWIEAISKQVNIPAKSFVYTNIEKMRNDYYQGKLNFIVASPLSILENFDPKQLTDGYKLTWSGVSEDVLLVVTRKDSGLNSFNTVRNKHLSILANEPISKMYVDTLALENFGTPAQQLFSQISYINKSSQLVYQLFFQKTDVIFVYQIMYNISSELNPQIRKKTQIIEKLPAIPRVLGFFHPRVATEFREKVLSEVEKLNTYPKGQQLLQLFQVDKAVRSNVADLDSIRLLKQRYLQLINTKRTHD
ncbi:MAG: PhnD/SsuA/transferrin family substrate-binding protein [Methylococcales bacterium]